MLTEMRKHIRIQSFPLFRISKVMYWFHSILNCVKHLGTKILARIKKLQLLLTVFTCGGLATSKESNWFLKSKSH